MNPIVLLQGWGYSGSIWTDLRSALADQLSLVPELGTHSTDLGSRAEALAQHILPGSILVGWSLGAMLAIETARRYPDKVAGLFLIGANAAFVASEHWPHGLAADIVAAFRQDFARHPARTLRRFLALQVMGDARRPALQALLESALASPDAPGLAAGLELLEGADLRDAIAAVHCPVCLLHGTHDAIMPVTAARALPARFRQARLIEIPDAGHCPLFSDPMQLASMIREFQREC